MRTAMTATETTDVLIVGLGPAGSSAARAAAKAGASAIAIEKRREVGVPVQCAEFTPALLAQEIDGLAALSRQTIAEMLTFVEDEAADRKPDFPGHIIDRAAFDAALAEKAAAAGARLRLGTALERIDAEGIAHLSDGTRIAARIAIGADGPRSRVGRAAGRVNRALVETRQITVPLRKPHDGTDIFLSKRIPGGYGWLFPKGEAANLGVGVAPEAKAELKPLLDALHRRLIDQGRVGTDILGHTGGAIPVGGPLDPVAQIGPLPVLLAGDAAGLAHPVTGAGIAAAVVSGRLAGEAAAQSITGDRGAFAAFAEEIADLFGAALARGLARRNELLARYRNDAKPSPSDLRRAWIAYDAYWAA